MARLSDCMGGQAQYSHDVCYTPGESHIQYYSNRTEGLCVHTSYMRCTIGVQYMLYKKLTKSHVLNGHLSPTTLNLLFYCCMDTYIIVVVFMVQPHKII